MTPGDKFRNLKSFAIGELVHGDETGQAGTFKVTPELGPEEQQVWAWKDCEPLDIAEYEVVRNFVLAKRKKTELNKLVAEASAEYGRAEEAIQLYLERRAIQGTKRYQDIGQVSIDGMKVFASISEENKEAAFLEIEAIGRGEVIKRTIHPMTLESPVGELVDTGVAVPEHISYVMKPKLSLAKKK